MGKMPTLIISGDFNLPGLKSWTVEDMLRASANSSARAENNVRIGADREQVAKLVDLVKDKALTQEVKIPTRESNILDLIFSNNSEYINYIDSVENVLMSDHKFLIAHLTKEHEVHQKQPRRTSAIPPFLSTT